MLSELWESRHRLEILSMHWKDYLCTSSQHGDKNGKSYKKLHISYA